MVTPKSFGGASFGRVVGGAPVGEGIPYLECYSKHGKPWCKVTGASDIFINKASLNNAINVLNKLKNQF